jgi:hypothetical protein
MRFFSFCRVLMMGGSGAEQGTEAEELTLAARQEEAVMFYMTSQMDVAQMFALELKKNPSLVLLKKQHEKHLLFGKKSY